MNGVADNIDTVAAAAGVLASIGGARYLGGKLSDLGSETANLIDARKNEIARQLLAQNQPPSRKEKRLLMLLPLSVPINSPSQNWLWPKIPMLKRWQRKMLLRSAKR